MDNKFKFLMMIFCFCTAFLGNTVPQTYDSVDVAGFKPCYLIFTPTV